jgi:hypothetical protein
VRKRLGINDGRNVERWGFDSVGQVFVLLTGCAAFDVFGDPCPCAGPEVFSVTPSYTHASESYVLIGHESALFHLYACRLMFPACSPFFYLVSSTRLIVLRIMG